MSSVYIPYADFTPHPNTKDFLAYRWNDKVVDNLFCKNCGIFTYFGNEEYGFRLNLGCVEGLDPLNLEIKVIDGKSMLLSDEPGPNPNDQE